jgi:hypothetical protein
MFASQVPFPLNLLVIPPDTSYTASVTKHLQIAEKEKFRGPSVNTAHTFVNGEMVIRALNDSNTILIPFIVNPFDGLGPIANRFLFGLRPDPAPDPLHLQLHSTTSQQAYENTMSLAAPIGLSHRADQYWSHHSPHLPFGRTYHAWFPADWIRQTLGASQHQQNICPTPFYKHPQKIFRSQPLPSTSIRPIQRHHWAFGIDSPCLLLRARLYR